MKYTVVVDQFEEREIRPPELYERYVSLVLDELPGLLGDRSEWTPCECPACGGGGDAPAFEKNGFVYRQCGRCGTLFASPRPAPHALVAFRARSLGEQFWRERVMAATAASRARHISSPRAEWIIDNALSVSIRPLAHLHVGPLHDLIPEMLAQRGVLDRVIAVCDEAEAAGVLKHPLHTVPRVSLASLRAVSGTLALVSLFEALEGEHGPSALLAELRGKLSTGGRLLLATVSADGFEVEMLRERARGVGLPSHLNLFSTQGISTLVERSGFRVLELSTPGQLDVELVAAACRANPEFSLPPFLERIVKSQDPSVLEHFQGFLQLARLSSHMRVVAEAV